MSQKSYRLCPELEFIIDGTEQPIRHPKNIQRQEKKRHTVKSNVVTEKRTRKVNVLKTTCEGKKHNKKLADEQAIPFPKGSQVWKDRRHYNVSTHEKTKGKELTTEQKQKNKELSRERIDVEHSIGGVKVFRIIHEIFRNFRKDFDDSVIETACGLHNAMSLLELFVDVDDFCQAFLPVWEKKLFADGSKKTLSSRTIKQQ